MTGLPARRDPGSGYTQPEKGVRDIILGRRCTQHEICDAYLGTPYPSYQVELQSLLSAGGRLQLHLIAGISGAHISII